MKIAIDESVKLASAALQARLRDGARRVVAVVGIEPGAGCTTIVAMMAAWMVEGQGLDPIAVDFIGGPKGLSARFGDAGASGLRALGQGRVGVADVVRRGPRGFNLVGIGPEPASDAGPDAIAGLRRLIAEAPPTSGPILVDAPPPLSRVDGILAAEVAGAALLVVPADRSPRQLVERTCTELAAHRVEILGAVLNYHRHRMPGWLYRRFR
ncbi:MAG: hypothetical protein JNK67_27235 [Alphaproteobacteria bacterium]|nr:hypothetical protein [Alphaproteobacteria bacterium]